MGGSSLADWNVGMDIMPHRGTFGTLHLSRKISHWLDYTGCIENMRIRNRNCALMLACLSICVEVSYAGNEVLGELQLEGATKVEKTSGVWIDGQYLGYLDELKGTKKILLLPGEHKI